MKTAIVHIGAEKTGSTSIQTSLNRSGKELAEGGVSYFRGSDWPVQLLSLGFRMRRRKTSTGKSSYLDLDEVIAASRSSWMALARQVRRSEVPLTVISEEAMLAVREVDQLAYILRRIFDRILIVVYVRNPALHFPSSIDQKVRGGVGTTDMIKQARLVPALLAKLERYENVFGSENMIVRNFDARNLVDGSPCADFANVISRFSSKPIRLKEVGPRNESLPASITLALLKENNRMLRSGLAQDRLWRQRRLQLINELRQIDRLQKGAKLRLEGGPLLGHLWQSALPEVEAINERYLEGQIPIQAGEAGYKLTKKETAAAFREWIESYQDPDVEEIVSRLHAMVYRPQVSPYPG